MDDLATAEYMTDRRLPGREDVKMTLAMSITRHTAIAGDRHGELPDTAAYVIPSGIDWNLRTSRSFSLEMCEHGRSTDSRRSLSGLQNLVVLRYHAY